MVGWGNDRFAVVGEGIVQDEGKVEGKEGEEDDEEGNAEDGSDNDATSKGDGGKDVVIADVDGPRGEHPAWGIC